MSERGVCDRSPSRFAVSIVNYRRRGSSGVPAVAVAALFVARVRLRGRDRQIFHLDSRHAGELFPVDLVAAMSPGVTETLRSLGTPSFAATVTSEIPLAARLAAAIFHPAFTGVSRTRPANRLIHRGADAALILTIAARPRRPGDQLDGGQIGTPRRRCIFDMTRRVQLGEPRADGR